MDGRDPSEPSADLADELIGLDLDHPETQAFAAHLRRMRRDEPAFTLEGYLSGVREFAESANRARGGRWLLAVLLAGLLLLVAGYVVIEAVGFILATGS